MYTTSPCKMSFYEVVKGLDGRDCRNTELGLRATSQCGCTGNADSLNKIATACCWGFHKYSGIAHFIEGADSPEYLAPALQRGAANPLLGPRSSERDRQVKRHKVDVIGGAPPRKYGPEGGRTSHQKVYDPILCEKFLLGFP